VLIRFIILLASVSFLAACSDSDSGGTAVSTQRQALTSSSQALSSLYSSQSSLSLASASRAQATDTICNADGSPKATGNNTEWAFHKFLCAGAHNTYSPDSALGALALANGIVCTAESLGLAYSEAGTSTTVTNVAFSTSCFSQEMITKFATDLITSLTATVTGYTMASTTGWDYRINVASATVGNFDLYIRNSGDVIAASMANTGSQDGWTISIDLRAATDYMVYEAANSNTHMRIMAEGTISSSGVVSAVTDMAGIHTMVGSTEYVALRGNETQGVQMRWLKSGNSEASLTCADVASSGATCTGVTALSFNSASISAFTNLTSAIDASLLLFDNNPIAMTVSGFVETPAATSAFASTLR
jgi:hypothetical protein